MSILISALAIAAAQSAQPATTAPAPAVDHSRHAQQGQKHEGDGCSCCKKMGEDKKMECCAKHGEGHGGERGTHSAH